jgi:ubiquinone biosynthesis protein UbiJ
MISAAQVQNMIVTALAPVKADVAANAQQIAQLQAQVAALESALAALTSRVETLEG